MYLAMFNCYHVIRDLQSGFQVFIWSNGLYQYFLGITVTWNLVISKLSRDISIVTLAGTTR